MDGSRIFQSSCQRRRRRRRSSRMHMVRLCLAGAILVGTSLDFLAWRSMHRRRDEASSTDYDDLHPSDFMDVSEAVRRFRSIIIFGRSPFTKRRKVVRPFDRLSMDDERDYGHLNIQMVPRRTILFYNDEDDDRSNVSVESSNSTCVHCAVPRQTCNELHEMGLTTAVQSYPIKHMG